jgi:hypothetical protein
MSISVIQAVEKNTLSSTISATGSGHGLIIAVDSYQATLTPSITSVKIGTTALTQAVAAVDTTDGTCNSWIYYLANAPSGQTSVTVTGTNLSVTASDGGVYIFEVAGLDLSSILDKHVGNSSGVSSTYSAATGTLSLADQFVVGTVDGVIPADASGWTAVGTHNGSACGYKIVSATTSLNYTGACSSSGWAAAVASFKAASANTNKAAAAVASML